PGRLGNPGTHPLFLAAGPARLLLVRRLHGSAGAVGSALSDPGTRADPERGRPFAAVHRRRLHYRLPSRRATLRPPAGLAQEGAAGRATGPAGAVEPLPRPPGPASGG